VNVKSNLYAKYYFELRELFKNCEYEFPAKPLTKSDEERLEISTINFKEGLKKFNGGIIPKMAEEKEATETEYDIDPREKPAQPE
jgi:hypothetical protein